MRWTHALAIALLAVAASAAPAAAQATVTTDMTRDEVVALRGAPLAERVAGDLTVLLYPGTCAVRCTTNDVVLVRDGRVVGVMTAEPAPAAVGAAPAESVDGAMGTARAPGLFPAHVADEYSTLRAPEPLRVRPYRLPGSFAPGEVEEFDRARAAAPRE